MIYVAGPWFTDTAYKRYNRLVTEAKELGLDCYFPREDVQLPPYETFIRNVEKIAAAEMIIAIMDEKDSGTAWELGMAYALHKPIYLMGDTETVFKSKTNIMLAFNGQCITIQDFANVCRKDLDGVLFFEPDKIKWENKE